MNILKNARIWFLISSILVSLSLLSLVVNYSQTGSILNYGIDFTGGTLIEIEIEDVSKTSTDLRTILEEYKDLSPFVQAAEPGVYLLKMKALTDEEHTKIMATLKEKLGGVTENRFTIIGPSVGETMKSKALFALIIAIIAIVLYIAFAFREIPQELSAWKFGFSAIIALVHDVIITIGVFSLMGIIADVEVDTLFITALLTVMGFSVHDTIVVFDRLRENVRYAKPTETFEDVGETSVKQTITRSINTSVSTLFPLVALYFFGAASISMFVLALSVGIVIGTYSSIFLATPVLVKWQGSELSDLRVLSDEDVV